MTSARKSEKGLNLSHSDEDVFVAGFERIDRFWSLMKAGMSRYPSVVNSRRALTLTFDDDKFVGDDRKEKKLTEHYATKHFIGSLRRLSLASTGHHIVCAVMEYGRNDLHRRKKEVRFHFHVGILSSNSCEVDEYVKSWREKYGHVGDKEFKDSGWLNYMTKYDKPSSDSTEKFAMYFPAIVSPAMRGLGMESIAKEAVVEINPDLGCHCF